MRNNTIRWLMMVVLVGGAGCSTMRKPAEEFPRPPGMSRAEYERILTASRCQVAGPVREFRGEEVGLPAEAARLPANVRAASAAALSPGRASNFVVSVWTKYHQLPSSAQAFSAIVGKFDPANPSASEWLVGLGSDGKVFLATTGSGSPARVTASRSLVSNQWAHVVGEWRGDGRATLYLNGQLEASAVLPVSPTGALAVVIGDVNPADGSKLFVGSVDDVRIYAKAADLNMVSNLYSTVPDRDGDGIRDGDDPDDNNDKIPDAWAYANFGSSLGGSPYQDPDGDSFLNWQEYISGSNPNDPYSTFESAPVKPAGGAYPVLIRCDGMAGRKYQAFYSSNVVARPQRWVALGTPAACSLTGPFDLPVTNSAALPRGFYRVVVSMDGVSF